MYTILLVVMVYNYCEHRGRSGVRLLQPETINETNMEDTAKKIFMETATGSKAIRIDISDSLNILGLPFMAFKKGERVLRFLLDTGASMNFLRKDILDEFSGETALLPYMTQFFGIDNVGHEAKVYSMSVNLGPHTFMEEFQELQGEDSLRFTLDDQVVQLDGIMGFPFFSKYDACISYGSGVIYIVVPDNQQVRTKSS